MSHPTISRAIDASRRLTRTAADPIFELMESGSRQPTLTVLFDRDCGVCTATARAVGRLDAGSRLEFVPAQTALIDGAPPRAQLLERLYATDAAGHWYSGAAAAVEIARRVPSLRIVGVVARVPGAMVVYELGYRMLAANRHRLSAALGLKVCAVPRRGGVRPS